MKPMLIVMGAAATALPQALDETDLLHPPLEWFSDATADAAPPALRVYPDGRVAGVVAPAQRCFLGGDIGAGECWKVPRPADGRGSTLDLDQRGEYATALVGSTMTAEGVEVPTANLAGAGGHASEAATIQAANRAYADVSRAVARGRYVWSDQAGGVVFVGALWPEMTPVQREVVRASAVSVDYRWLIDEHRYDLVGACLVNVGALPSRWRQAVTAGASILTTSDDYQEAVMDPEETEADCGCDEVLDPVLAAAQPGDPMSQAVPTDPEVLQRLDAVDGKVDEALKKVTDVLNILLEQRTAGATSGLPVE